MLEKPCVFVKDVQKDVGFPQEFLKDVRKVKEESERHIRLNSVASFKNS